MVSNVSILEEKINIHTNYDITLLSPIKCGGRVKYITFPSTLDEVIESIKFSKQNDLKLFILGGLTNTLVLDSGLDGLAISTKNLKGITVKDDVISAKCGESLSHVIQSAINNNLSGLEQLSGIPGTIGGALKGNAGSYNKAISDIFYSAEIVLPDLSIKKIYNSDDLFSYRASNLPKDSFIYSVSLRLNKVDDNKPLIKQREEYILKRKEVGQYDKPSLGCVFKNPTPLSAGLLIDKCGLKGLSYNGAAVSESHANFITVEKNTTANSYLTLVNKVREEVFKRFGITLDYEINIMGQNWA